MSIDHQGSTGENAEIRMMSLGLHQISNGLALAAAAETTMRMRVVRHIERHIESQELSPMSICRHVGVSRSQLYRLFVDDGGVANYIRLRRLVEARAELISPSRQRISNVAYKYGFTSHAHFSRVFKQHFGHTPWECIASSRAAVPTA
jgi:AraC-like DNA-binding protein